MTKLGWILTENQVSRLALYCNIAQLIKENITNLPKVIQHMIQHTIKIMLTKFQVISLGNDFLMAILQNHVISVKNFLKCPFLNKASFGLP